MGGWVVGWNRGREGPFEGGQRRYEDGGVGWEGRSRQNVPRNVPFSVPLFLLPTVVTNTPEFSCSGDSWDTGEGRRGKEEKKEAVEKGGERPMQAP